MRVHLPEQADVQGAAEGAVDLLHLDAEALGGAQQASRCLDELAALGRKREAGAAALAEAKAEAGFQRGSCALMVGWLVLSVPWAAEMPPASTTARNTRIRRMSSSDTLPSIVDLGATHIGRDLCEQ